MRQSHSAKCPSKAGTKCSIPSPGVPAAGSIANPGTKIAQCVLLPIDFAIRSQSLLLPYKGIVFKTVCGLVLPPPVTTGRTRTGPDPLFLLTQLTKSGNSSQLRPTPRKPSPTEANQSGGMEEQAGGGHRRMVRKWGWTSEEPMG